MTRIRVGCLATDAARAPKLAKGALRIGWASALVAALLVVAAPPAGAEVFRLTGDQTAERPEIAVDRDGTAHVVWDKLTGRDHVLVYCRVPRGARACAAMRSFPLPGVDGALGVTHATLTPRGELVLTTTRSFDAGTLNPGTRVYAIVSTDLGASFLEPRAIAEFTRLPEVVSAESGPGDFSLSLALSDESYSAVPLDGLTTSRADFDFGTLDRVSLGFSQPLWPVVVTSRRGLVMRRWRGLGDYNDAANWLPEARVDRGSAPLLASGLGGLYLLNEDRGESGRERSRLRVRHFNPTLGAFGPSRIVSRSGAAGYSQFGDFHQDPRGRLHAVFSEALASGRRQLSRRMSVDGVKWGPIQALAPGVSGGRVAAARDGAGAVVFADSKGISLAPFGRPGSGPVECPPEVTVGVVVVRALEGCLRKDGSRFTTGGAVKVNGVDVEPRAGNGLYRLTVDKNERTLETLGEASVRAGGVTLDRGEVSWKLPQGEGRLQRLGVPDGSVFPDLARFAKTLFSFPVKGDAELRVTKEKTALIDTSFQMPALLGGVTGAVTLRTSDERGLVLDGFKIKVPQARIGKLRVAEVEVVYESDPDIFKGGAKIQLPPAYGEPVEVTFGFREGRLNLLHVEKGFVPTLPIVGVAPEPVVGLDRLAFDYLDEAGSRTFQGTVDLQGGPEVRGLFRVSELDGKVTLTFPPDPKPAAIDATGTLKVVGLPFATGHVRYSTDNLFTFDGTFQFPPPGLADELAKFSASVEGFLALSNPYPFSASGDATVTIAGITGSGEAVISSKGVTACVPVEIFGIERKFGVSYRWGDLLPSPSCDVGEFKLEPPAARVAQEGQPVQIPAGLPQAALAIVGQGGAPRVRLTAPTGEQITTSPQPLVAGRFIAQALDEAATTYVSIGEPPGGVYTVEPEPGSPPIASVSLARGLPDPAVTAKVLGRGRKRTLRYRVRRIAGQRVTFAEQSKGGLYRELASTRKALGRIRFRPADSSRRQRRIVALVHQDGYPRAKLELARFTAPEPRPLARPRRVRARRKGNRLIVRWSRVRRARGYEVRINLPRDGRRLLRFTKSGRRRLTIGGLERNDRGTVTVRALDDEASPGRARKARLRPKPAKRGVRR